MNLASTVLAPPETKGSILAVFNQKVKSYIVSDKLSQMLSLTNFDLHNISNQKTAIFVIGGHKMKRIIYFHYLLISYFI